MTPPDWGVRWPLTWEAWVGLALIYVIGLAFFTQGLALFRQSTWKDRLAWAYIISALGVGVSFLAGTAISLMPRFAAYPWVRWVLWGILGPTVVYGIYQTIRATRQRQRFYVLFVLGFSVAFWGGARLLAWWLGTV